MRIKTSLKKVAIPSIFQPPNFPLHRWPVFSVKEAVSNTISRVDSALSQQASRPIPMPLQASGALGVRGGLVL